jgi:hypothetical protein
VLVYAIMFKRAGSWVLPVYPQKGNMSNVQPVVDADSTAWSAVSARETYGSSCGATSMPYAIPMITCPAMLQRRHESLINDLKQRRRLTTADDVYSVRVYEGDSPKVGGQLLALEADIVDSH